MKKSSISFDSNLSKHASYIPMEMCVDKNLIYIFSEVHTKGGSPKVIIWCINTSDFERKDTYLFMEPDLQKGSLADCYVQHGVILYSYESGSCLKTLVVRDKKNDMETSFSINSQVKATLWNNKVLFFDEVKRSFTVWNKAFTQCWNPRMRYNCLVFDRCW